MTNLKTIMTAFTIALVLGTSAFAETPKSSDTKKTEKHEHKAGDHDDHKDDGKHADHKEGDEHHDEKGNHAATEDKKKSK